MRFFFRFGYFGCSPFLTRRFRCIRRIVANIKPQASKQNEKHRRAAENAVFCVYHLPATSNEFQYPFSCTPSLESHLWPAYIIKWLDYFDEIFKRMACMSAKHMKTACSWFEYKGALWSISLCSADGRYPLDYLAFRYPWGSNRKTKY